jgi:hypothetical protein
MVRHSKCVMLSNAKHLGTPEQIALHAEILPASSSG